MVAGKIIYEEFTEDAIKETVVTILATKMIILWLILKFLIKILWP